MSRLDREAKEEYTLEIMVKDGGIPTAKKVLLVYSCVSLSTIVQQMVVNLQLSE